MFSVFRNNTETDLHLLLPATPAAAKYQQELESELDTFRVSLLNRIEQELML